jgi:hypothetical protein
VRKKDANVGSENYIAMTSEERMIKAPEEGEIWEWRAFGRLNAQLKEQIEARPMRLDPSGNPLANIIGQDLYLISPSSDHNIKLRKSFGGDWVLKFKLLLKTEARLIELYHESEKKSFRFPVSSRVVEETAQLLNVTLSESKRQDEKLTDAQFLNVFAQAMPALLQVSVGKIRSQYQFANGWVELADVRFPQAHLQSISLHAFALEGIEAMLNELQIDDQFEAMNYLEACRRWE